MTIGLAVLAVSLCFAIYEIIGLKKYNNSLRDLNNILSQQITEYKSKNSSLWAEINKISSTSDELSETLKDVLEQQEKHIISAGVKVSWISKKGNEEFGIVYDSFNTADNSLVVVRGIKNNKPTARYFTVGFDKLKIID